MSMFCFQCQEAANGKACEIKGVCGKDAICAGLQDLLIYTAKGVSIYQKVLREAKLNDSTNDEWLYWMPLTQVVMEIQKFQLLSWVLELGQEF